jgi:hypothetical protein
MEEKTAGKFIELNVIHWIGMTWKNSSYPDFFLGQIPIYGDIPLQSINYR